MALETLLASASAAEPWAAAERAVDRSLAVEAALESPPAEARAEPKRVASATASEWSLAKASELE